MDAASALETLSSLLTSIADSPYTLSLHSQHIQLASLPLPDLTGQLDSAVQLFLDFYAATDAVWLPFLQEKIQGLGISDEFETSDEPAVVNLQGITVEAVLNVLESFRKAENDYLCEHLTVYASLGLTCRALCSNSHLAKEDQISDASPCVVYFSTLKFRS